MKKSIFFIIFIFIFLTSFSVPVSADYYNMNLEDMRSDAYLLINVDTGTTVFSQNADKQLKCASLVKTATAIVVVENCENLDAVVTVTESALEPLKGVYSASSDLQVGEQISVRNLMYCMMLQNSNDAANVLAEYVGGSIENFVNMMNNLAKKLGCKNTNFTNAHGLDEEGEYSSANDMYLLTKYAMNISVLADMAATEEYTVPATNMSEARELTTRLDIVEKGTRYYYDYAKGFKVGHTDESQRCASVVATKDAYTYIAIVLGCPNECIDNCGYPDNTALYEARRMLRWAVRELKMTTIAGTSDILTDIPVALSSQADHVRLVPEKQIQALLLSSVDESSLEYIFELAEDVKAPVNKGDILGKVKIKYADNVIAEVNLVAGDSLKRNAMMYAGHIIKTIVTNPVFIIVVSVAVLVLLVYMMIVYNKYKKQQKKAKDRMKEIKQQNYVEDSNIFDFDKIKK